MKIDLTKLNGYNEEMSAEDKLNLILGTDFTEPNKIDKATFDKTASELASYKKQVKESMSTAEREKVEAQERYDALKAENESLKKDKIISGNRANYLALGYSNEMADKAANALYDGDTNTLFELQKSFTEDARASAIADKVKSMGTPVGGQPTNTSYTKEQIASMSMDEINANWEAVSEALKN